MYDGSEMKTILYFKIDCVLALSILTTKATSNQTNGNNERKIIADTGTVPIIAHSHTQTCQPARAQNIVDNTSTPPICQQHKINNRQTIIIWFCAASSTMYLQFVFCFVLFCFWCANSHRQIKRRSRAYWRIFFEMFFCFEPQRWSEIHL